MENDCQVSEDKTRTPGCCGLSLRRPGRTKKSASSSGTANSKTSNKHSRKGDTRKGRDSSHSADLPSNNPLNLAGITLNLSSCEDSTNHPGMTDQSSDNRLDEFKKLFCGGNELHCVDFIRIWGFYDKDHSGYLETKELDKFIKDLIQQKGQKPNPDLIKNVREAILKTADVNKDGKIELAEFSSCLPVEKNFLLQFDARQAMTRKEFYDVFTHYDPDDNGYIEGHEILALLRDIMAKKGIEIQAHELDEYREMFIKAYDKDKDGKLSRDELGMLLSIDK